MKRGAMFCPMSKFSKLSKELKTERFNTKSSCIVYKINKKYNKKCYTIEYIYTYFNSVKVIVLDPCQYS